MSTGADPIVEDAPEIDVADVELTGPERRCVVTGETLPKDQLLRFAVSPEGVLVPDIAEKLPGRGIWIKATRDVLDQAIKRNVFSRAARRQVTIPAGCAETVIDLVQKRTIEAIGFARRSGTAVCGFEKVEGRARAGRLHALIIASDAGKDGRGKLEALVGDTHIIDVLDSRALTGVFGTIGIVVYAGISDKAHAARLISLAAKLKALIQPVHMRTE